MTNKKKFLKLMMVLSELHGREISDTLMDVYWEVLKAYQDEVAIRALNQVIASCRFFPKPADILDHIHGNREDAATEAWLKVDKAMRHNGNYQSINFGDPKIHNCIELLGGWHYLGTLTEDEWKWKRKEFESAYRSIRSLAGPNHVAGLFEMDAAKNGFERKEPLRIGQKAETKLLPCQ